MPTINQLPAVTQVSGKDQMPLYVTNQGDARRCSVTTLLNYFSQNFASPDYETIINAPTNSGFNVDLGQQSNNVFLIINPTGTFAAGSVTLPPVASCFDGQQIVLASSAAIGAFSINANGATVIGAPTGLNVGGGWTLRFSAIQDTWYCIASDPSASEVSFIQAGTGAIVRTAQDKMREVVSIQDFGAVGNGTTDDTAAIQAALNSGANAVFIPPGKTYLFSTLTIPNIINFTFFGAGPASQLKMKSGGSGIIWAGNAGSIYYMQGTLADFYIDGTNGSNHCINTAGVGGLDLNNIYIKNVPTGYDGIHVDGFNSVFTHDIRINNYRCYSNTAGRAGIGFGPYAADASVSQFIMNGNMVVEYGLWFDSGVNQVNVADSHIYNAGENVVYSDGASRLFFTHCVIDRSTNNLVEIQNGSSHINFVTCFFEAIQAGKIGINIGGVSQFITISESQFQGTGATSAVKSDATTNGVRVFNCDISGQTWSSGFDLTGTTNFEIGNLGTTPLGVSFGFSGVATTAQAQNTTSYLGLNGGQPTEGAAVYVAPYNGYLKNIIIAVETTPAAGQDFTFTVRKNGVDIGTPLVVTNGGFGGTITLNTTVAAQDRISVKSVFSATSGSSRPRWAASFVG